MSVKRPILRYYGGKWLLAPWIISMFPSHRIYVEPFGGAGSVLLRKTRVHGEVWNDLDGEMVNMFRVLRDRETADLLCAQLRLTPYARDEFEAAYQVCDDPVERARRCIVRCAMGFGAGGFHRRGTGFRSNTNRSGTVPSRDFMSWPDAVPAICQRLSGVVIENRDALEVAKAHDGTETLIYFDPPYVHETRTRPDYHAYAHEMSDADHRDFLSAVTDGGLQSMIAISGYDCELYGRLEGWRKVQRMALADGAQPRTECLWLNPSLCERLDAERDQVLPGIDEVAK